MPLKPARYSINVAGQKRRMGNSTASESNNLTANNLTVNNLTVTYPNHISIEIGGEGTIDLHLQILFVFFEKMLTKHPNFGSRYDHIYETRATARLS